VNAPRCYVVRTLPLVIFFLQQFSFKLTKRSNNRAFIVSERCKGKFLSSSRQKMSVENNFYFKELSARSLLIKRVLLKPEERFFSLINLTST
jgi:hypothetical protein